MVKKEKQNGWHDSMFVLTLNRIWRYSFFFSASIKVDPRTHFTPENHKFICRASFNFDVLLKWTTERIKMLPLTIHLHTKHVATCEPLAVSRMDDMTEDWRGNWTGDAFLTNCVYCSSYGQPEDTFVRPSNYKCDVYPWTRPMSVENVTDTREHWERCDQHKCDENYDKSSGSLA